MPGLTAKVFRTFNASITLEKELASPELDVDLKKPLEEKIYIYNKANREVAILCNHQRSVPKAFDAQMDKLDQKIAERRDTLRKLKHHLDVLAGKKKPLNVDEDEKPVTKSKDPDAVKKTIKRTESMINKLNVQKQLKEDNKTVALGTSKINYMDPRITVAWCKRKQVPIEKIFNKSLLEKFPWAMEVPKSWNFLYCQ
jgi:DNA topoisomerase-1